MKIKTITTDNRVAFDEQVNALLSEGWELHGPPFVIRTAHHDTWNGRQRSWSETTYSQTLKKNE